MPWLVGQAVGWVESSRPHTHQLKSRTPKVPDDPSVAEHWDVSVAAGAAPAVASSGPAGAARRSTAAGRAAPRSAAAGARGTSGPLGPGSVRPRPSPRST